MRVFVSEYIAGGALSGSPLPMSLLCEGQAMLGAIVADFLAIPGYQVVTTLDCRVAEALSLTSSPFLTTVIVDHPLDEQSAFLQACTEADATLVIAPETGNVLRQRVQSVLDWDRPSLNCSPAAIDLCGDKLRLAAHLTERGISTISTQILRGETPPWEIAGGDSVVKPRDGAGSWLTTLVREHDETAWRLVRDNFAAQSALDRAIVQPWISGTPLSVGCLCTSSNQIETFPIARQYLTEGSFQYEGGTIPVQLDDTTTNAIEALVQSACRSISGLRGYVGVDLLLPDHSPTVPVLVEINPRMTTSYVGYRKLSQINLAKRMLTGVSGMGSSLADVPLTCRPGHVKFDAAGECRYSPE